MSALRYGMKLGALLIFPLSVLLLAGCVQSLEFTVEGDTARMRGELESDAVERVERLLDSHPNLSTIIMVDVPGSLDDEATLAAARVVRDASLRIVVPSDGEIASGGVDFFLAGRERDVAEGGRVGVHSWAEGRTEGAELPRDDPRHSLYLEYYDAMGIAEDFYWFTLNAASSSDIHWMTRAELEQYQLITEP